MRDIFKIVLHCSASPNGRADDVQDIDRWHKERGWSGVGYHYVIPCTGEVQAGRPEQDVGAHAAGYNAFSLGVCMIGTDKFTEAQWYALSDLVDDLQARFPEAEIWGHGAIPGVNKACPGFDVDAWIASDHIPNPENII